MLDRVFASRKRPYIPGLKNKDKLQVDLSGTKFTVSLPPSSTSMREYNDKFVKSPNIYDENSYETLEKLPRYQQLKPSSFLIVYRSFGFWGAFFRSGHLGTLNFSVSVCKENSLPPEMSCLNFSHFEQVVIRHLYFNSGPGSGRRDIDPCPVDWKNTMLNGSRWIYCETVPNVNRSKSDEKRLQITEANKSCHYYAPLDEKHYLFVNFRIVGYLPVESCFISMDKVKNNIMDNSSLCYSGSVSEKLNQMSTLDRVGEHREPEMWRNHIFKDSTCREILQAGSPQPEWSC